eukprot:751711-Hanusia_phi.AAC.1
MSPSPVLADQLPQELDICRAVELEGLHCHQSRYAEKEHKYQHKGGARNPAEQTFSVDSIEATAMFFTSPSHPLLLPGTTQLPCC